MSKAHLLIADNDKNLVNTFSRFFEHAGYNVSKAYSGMEAVQRIAEHQPDLALIDYEMPKLKGTDVIEWIRGEGLDFPVILMTGYNLEQLQIESLNLGSDDYVSLPVDIRILLARVQVRLKRHNSKHKSIILHFADIELNTQAHTARRGSRSLELTRTEYNLLLLFLQHPYHVLDRDQIIQHVWKHDFVGESQIVDTYVKFLRRKLEASGEERLIQTVQGVGYVLRN